MSVNAETAQRDLEVVAKDLDLVCELIDLLWMLGRYAWNDDATQERIQAAKEKLYPIRDRSEP